MEKTPHKFPLRPGFSSVLSFAISEALNEDTRLPATPTVPLETIAVDWSSVRYVCSAGIVIWLNWVHAVRRTQPGIAFEFHGCPTALISLITTVNGILPKNGRVVSFQVPYYLGETRLQHLVTIERDQTRELTADDIRRQIQNHLDANGQPPLNNGQPARNIELHAHEFKSSFVRPSHPPATTVELDCAPGYLSFLKAA